MSQELSVARKTGTMSNSYLQYLSQATVYNLQVFACHMIYLKVYWYWQHLEFLLKYWLWGQAERGFTKQNIAKRKLNQGDQPIYTKEMNSSRYVSP